MHKIKDFEIFDGLQNITVISYFKFISSTKKIIADTFQP